jgi:hypothetical protein
MHTVLGGVCSGRLALLHIWLQLSPLPHSRSACIELDSDLTLEQCKDLNVETSTYNPSRLCGEEVSRAPTSRAHRTTAPPSSPRVAQCMRAQPASCTPPTDWSRAAIPARWVEHGPLRGRGERALHRRPVTRRVHRLAGRVRRTVVSEIEAPNLLVNLV